MGGDMMTRRLAKLSLMLLVVAFAAGTARAIPANSSLEVLSGPSYVGGVLANSTTWTVDGSPYVVQTDLTRIIHENVMTEAL
jgi:hypothetical protein